MVKELTMLRECDCFSHKRVLMVMIESEACEARKRVTKYFLSNFINYDRGILVGDHERVMFK